MSRITAFCYLPGPARIPSDRLYLDWSLPCEPAAEELSRRGIDTVTANSAGLNQASITEQLAYAAERKRMFVTRRPQRLELFWQKPHAGVSAWCSD